MKKKSLKILLFFVFTICYTTYAEACFVNSNPDKNTGWCIAGVDGGITCITQQVGEARCIGNIIEVE